MLFGDHIPQILYFELLRLILNPLILVQEEKNSPYI